MKKRRIVIMFVLLIVVFTLVVVAMAILNNQGSNAEAVTTTEGHFQAENSYQTQELPATEEESKENEIISENSTMEGEEPLKETRFGYMHGIEYDEEEIPRRFGYVVEEEIEEREIPLQEEDFKQLRKEQYFYSGFEKATIPIGIVDVIGLFDGQIMHTKRAPGTGDARTSPYYKIDDNTYVILFFEYNNYYNPLDHIEVWDADGNKLRDIEID